MQKDSVKIAIVFILLALGLCLQSCGTQGYGCKGRASWSDVVRKANRLY